VVAVAVRDVDRYEILALGGDPVGKITCLPGGQQRIDENSILLARYERGRDGWPRPLLQTRRQVVSNGWLGWRDIDVPPESGE
jgi:hypothetical protein